MSGVSRAGEVGISVRFGGACFFAERASTGGLDLEHLTASDVSAFVVGACRDGRNASARQMVSALRSLLVFLRVEGLICEGLADVGRAVVGYLRRLRPLWRPGALCVREYWRYHLTIGLA